MYICSKHKFDFIVRICLYYTSFMNEFEVLSVFRSPCEQSPIFSTDVLDRALQESRQIFVEHARGLRVACALSLREDHFILACTRAMA